MNATILGLIKSKFRSLTEPSLESRLVRRPWEVILGGTEFKVALIAAGIILLITLAAIAILIMTGVQTWIAVSVPVLVVTGILLAVGRN